MSKFSREEITKALQILEANKDIRDEHGGLFPRSNERIIHLTEKGLASFNTRLYEKELEKSEFEVQLRKSTLSTNRTTVIVAVVSLMVACAATIVATLQYLKTDEIRVQGLDTLIKTMQIEYTHKPIPKKENTPSPLPPLDSAKSLRKN